MISKLGIKKDVQGTSKAKLLWINTSIISELSFELYLKSCCTTQYVKDLELLSGILKIKPINTMKYVVLRIHV
jgi:hypothetical protein